MVSKLHLAVTEVCLEAIDDNADADVVDKLKTHFHQIGEGIGVHKSPELYGAFPTDPYSHTPFHRGAQQPGMTGQVKEDILARLGELGVFIEDGMLLFKPTMLKRVELLEQQESFKYSDLEEGVQEISLDPGTLAFTCCQVPVVYRLSDHDAIQVQFRDGKQNQIEDLQLDKETSGKIFQRTGEVKLIQVDLKEEHLT